MPITRNGKVATETRQNLIDGLRSKPMTAEAVDEAMAQAVTFAERLVEKYSTAIAAGEVGPGGSARASDSAVLANRSPTILMYGRVQSGKTAAMVLTSALCFDNGFRVVVVLTSDILALVNQTVTRFKALSGPRVFSTIRVERYEWEGQEDELREDVARDGLVLVCAKNDMHLGRIMAFLQQIDAPSYPAIIFDDEADAATPDTTALARAQGRPNAPEYPSAIHRRVFDNPKPGQEGESLGEIFPHKIYVQVTATPFIFFLQRENSPIRPDETLLLEPGEGYCGGEKFFDDFDPADATLPRPPLIFVPPNELLSIPRRNVPVGLGSSIDFFLLSATARAVVANWPQEGFKHLSHSSPSMGHHDMVAAHITRHLAEVRRILRSPDAEACRHFADAYGELQRSMAAPDLIQLVGRLRGAIQQSEIIVVNSAHEMPQRPGPRFNFLIGGNILGRGLTIDDLLVTYYVREARVSQMDTVWQHARMYGYRTELMSYTRVFLPRRVAANFRGIHEAETTLRALLERDPQGANPVLLVPRGTRATRPNAVDSSYPRVIQAGTAQVAAHRVAEDRESAATVLNILRRLGVPLSAASRDARTTPVSFDAVLELVNSVSIVENDTGLWDSDAIGEILEAYKKMRGEFGFVYVRQLEGSTDRTRARLAGPEVALIRDASNNLPALVLLYVGDADAPRGWHPTLVMPADSPNIIISPPEV
jgi:hypothetical protein